MSHPARRIATPATTSGTSNPINTNSVVDKIETAQPDPVVAGENLTYSLTIVNRGKSDAADVFLTDVLPAHTSFVSYAGSGAFAAPGSCSFDNNTRTLSCRPSGGSPSSPPDSILRAGASGTVTLSFTDGTIQVVDTLPVDGMTLVQATSTGPGSLLNAFVCTQGWPPGYLLLPGTSER
ncbi:MAG: DUF11 domain-containing protein [Acidobacteria bacterium]|nr:DUF11 domain-containing protein [Acidobacteriota bacterium]